MADEVPGRRFTRASESRIKTENIKGTDDEAPKEDIASEKDLLPVTESIENKEEVSIILIETEEEKPKASVVTRSTTGRRKRVKKDNTFVGADGQKYQIGDTVYVDSHRPDIPWYMGTIKEIKSWRKESILIEWFYRPSEVPELTYQTLVQDRRLENTNCARYLDEPEFKLKELFVSKSADYCSPRALRGLCKVYHFTDIPESELHDFIKHKDNWFYVLSYNPSSRRLASTQGEIRIGASHQAELPQFIEMDIETRIKYCKSPETKCWLPGKLSDKDLQHYIWAARSITALAGICNGGNLEKGLTVSSHDSASFNALEWLHFNKYDTSKALTGMVTNPLPSQVEGKWAEEEKRLFEQGIKQFGKHFDKIRREYLPKKNTNDLVEYYYLWKITPEAFHVRFQKKKGSKNNGHPFSKKSKMKSKEYSSDNGEVSSGSGTAYSDTEESNAEDEDLKNREDIRCDHCKIDKSDTWRYGGLNKMVLCVNCRLHFKRFGDMPTIEGNGVEESSLSDTSQAKSSSPLTSGEDVKVKKEDETPMEESSEQNEEDTTLEIVEEEEEEEVEEDELEMIDEEDSEPPNEMINKTYGDHSIKFERPSCRGLDKCARTDMKFICRQEKTTPKKETPVAKTDPTPIKSEIDPLTTPRVDIGVQPFNFSNVPSQSTVPKLEPSYHAKMFELYQQHEAAAKMQKLQQEGLYNMPQGLRPPLNMLQAFNMRGGGAPPPNLINSVEAQQKLLQGIHPSVHPEQLMAIDAWARQQQQQVQQAQQREQQQQQQTSNPLEHIQRVLEQAKTPAEHQKLREQIASFEASREAWARHLENPAQQPPTSQWQRFVETQALAVAQQRGFEIPNLAQQRQLLQQPPTSTSDRRKQRPYPFHQLFPVMARRHRDKKKQECRLKTDDDEVIYMGIGNQQPRTVAPQHLPHITNTAAKASFSPLTSQHRMSLPQGINTLPQGLSNIPGLGQLPVGLNNLQYANFLKVLSNPNMLRGHL